MNILIQTLLFFCISFSALAQSPTYDCNEYLELHKVMNCHPNHYLKKFAFKYCSRYQKRVLEYSEKGQQWVKNVRQCLLARLIESPNINTCDSIAEAAYLDHTYCYVEHGFCDLAFDDQRRVFFQAWDSLYNLHIGKSIFDIRETCRI